MTIEQAAKDLLAIIDSEMYVNDFGGLQAGRDATTDIHAAMAKLQEALAQTKQEPWCMTMNGCKTKCEDCPDTITAIKEALAQQEQENQPVFVLDAEGVPKWLPSKSGGLLPPGTRFYTSPEAQPGLAQPEQEPVGWMWQHDETGRVGFVDLFQVENGWQKGNPRLILTTPLYTSPPKREWVGLTDAEIRVAAHIADPGDWNDDRYQKLWHLGFAEGARGAESMLKEKNYD